MAFGQNSTSSNSFGPNAKLYYATIKQKDLPAPVIEITRKKPGADKVYEVVEPAARFLSGNLIEIRNRKTKVKDNKELESVSAVFQDGDDVVFLQIHHNYLGWNILNSLCNLKTFENLELGVYQSKPREGQTKTFPSSVIRQNNQMVKGKFANDELPAIPKHVIGRDTISDKTARTAFFVAQVEELAKVVKASAPVNPKGKSQTAGVTDGHESDLENGDGPSDEDVPF